MTTLKKMDIRRLILEVQRIGRDTTINTLKKALQINQIISEIESRINP